jgi:hypothetical protein
MIRRTKSMLMLFLALAVLGNVLLPFYAPLMAESGKVAICTANGITYVDASEVGGAAPQEHDARPHCPLCVLQNHSLSHYLPGVEANAAFTALWKENEITPRTLACRALVYHVPHAPRAPPAVRLI